MDLFKLLGNKRLFILLIGLILFISVMGFTLGSRVGLTWPEKFVKDTVGFIQYVFYKPARSVAGFFEDVSDLRSLELENEELKISLAHYAREKPKYNAMEKQNEQLKNDLKFTEDQKNLNNYDYRIAQVVSVNNDASNRTLVINLGSRNGIKENMSVTSTEGLVGIISRVSNFTSTVKLLTSMDSSDPKSKGISAKVEGKENETFGIVDNYDEKTGTLLMTRIPLDSPLKKDDIIVTGGDGGIYPKYQIIGKVLSRQKGDFGMTYTATIKPAANFVDWKELFVVFTPEVKE
ncbi:rod shape-determining protein MreC [Paenibacillus shirakamiensis]|uniref:Cell shape-determining protein MreC n=1 Tax=Paenibacillus shirakamiensis TaxID=1265935 RepID=A0ABS4JH18_9BACL|nr:rod shape-determining protein MreC [Paenibacillus shirakamiensis]